MAANGLQINTVSRGFHVYSNTENWSPKVGHKLTFVREFHNAHDRFAGLSCLRNWHHPLLAMLAEKSRDIWFALEKDAQITAEVVDTAPKRSPLIQRGLVILIVMTIFWDNAEHIETLKNKIGSINFIVYNDSSKAILTEHIVPRVRIYYSLKFLVVGKCVYFLFL